MQNPFDTYNSQVNDKPLGNYLVEAGLLSPDQVEVILTDQQQTGRLFGEIAAALGWIKQQTIEYLMHKVIFAERQAPEVAKVLQQVEDLLTNGSQAQSLNKYSFKDAILKLRSVLELDPYNTHCHTLLGIIYLKQNQLMMAKVHFDQVLMFNSEDVQALAGKASLEKVEQKARQSRIESKIQIIPETKAPQKPKSRGLFGFLKW